MKAVRTSRNRVNRAEKLMYRQVLAALQELRRSQSPLMLTNHRASVDQLPRLLAQAQATVRKTFMTGYREGKALVDRG